MGMMMNSAVSADAGRDAFQLRAGETVLRVIPIDAPRRDAYYAAGSRGSKLNGFICIAVAMAIAGFQVREVVLGQFEFQLIGDSVSGLAIAALAGFGVRALRWRKQSDDQWGASHYSLTNQRILALTPEKLIVDQIGANEISFIDDENGLISILSTGENPRVFWLDHIDDADDHFRFITETYEEISEDEQTDRPE